jgi:hypothetical protein
MKIPIPSEFTAIVTGHGKQNPSYTGLKQQITRRAPATRGRRHLNIYVCKILESQTSSLIQHITARGGERPPTNELVANYLNAFSRFIKSILSKIELDHPST